MQLAVAGGDRGGYRQAHGHPVVGFAIQHRPLQSLASGNGHAVFELLDRSSHRTQLAGHHGEAIGFLHP